MAVPNLLHLGLLKDFPSFDTLEPSHEGLNNQLISAHFENSHDEEQNGAIFSWRCFLLRNWGF